jgi:hypothetical protein
MASLAGHQGYLSISNVLKGILGLTVSMCWSKKAQTSTFTAVDDHLQNSVSQFAGKILQMSHFPQPYYEHAHFCRGQASSWGCVLLISLDNATSYCSFPKSHSPVLKSLCKKETQLVHFT